MVGNYQNLFNREGEQIEGESGDDEIEFDFHSHWGWIATIDDLARGDRTKWEFYLKMNLMEFLNELAYRKDKRENTSNEIMKLIKNKTSQEATILLLSYLINK